MIKTLEGTLVEKTKMTDSVYSFKFTINNGETLNFKAGQYVILHIPQEDGKLQRRLYSIASPPSDNTQFELIIELVSNGVGSNFLLDKKVGDVVKIQGPAGMFTLQDGDEDITFLATGTGIAPIRSMLYDILQKQPLRNVTVYWGFPYFKSMYLFEEFNALAKEHNNVTFFACVSREDSLDTINPEHQTCFKLGRITSDLNFNPNTHYYICGSKNMVESVKELLYSNDIPKENVFFERFN